MNIFLDFLFYFIFFQWGQRTSEVKESDTIFALGFGKRISQTKVCGERGSKAAVYYSRVNPSIALDIWAMLEVSKQSHIHLWVTDPLSCSK